MLDLLNILLRHRWWVAAATMLGFLLAALMSFSDPYAYTAATTFLAQDGTDPGRSRLSSLAGRLGIDVSGSASGQSPQFYADLVTSREILADLAGERFTVSRPGAPDEGARSGTVADLLGVQEVDAAERRAAVVSWLRSAVATQVDNVTGVVEVGVTSPWPALSRDLATGIVEHVNAFNLNTRQTQAAVERRFIEERLADAQERLRESENELQQFLKNNRQFENSPELLFEYERLQREVALRQEVHSSLVQSYEQVRISEVRNTPVITVVERAELPLRPNPRRVRPKLILGLLLGATVGLLIALGREYMERTRQLAPERYREFIDLWSETGEDVKRFIGRFMPSSRG